MTAVTEIPETLYLVVYGETFDWTDEPYIFVYSGVHFTQENAEQMIMNYAVTSDQRGTFCILEYSRPPF